MSWHSSKVIQSAIKGLWVSADLLPKGARAMGGSASSSKANHLEESHAGGLDLSEAVPAPMKRRKTASETFDIKMNFAFSSSTIREFMNKKPPFMGEVAAAALQELQMHFADTVSYSIGLNTTGAGTLGDMHACIYSYNQFWRGFNVSGRTLIGLKQTTEEEAGLGVIYSEAYTGRWGLETWDEFEPLVLHHHFLLNSRYIITSSPVCVSSFKACASRPSTRFDGGSDDVESIGARRGRIASIRGRSLDSSYASRRSWRMCCNYSTVCSGKHSVALNQSKDPAKLAVAMGQASIGFASPQPSMRRVTALASSGHAAAAGPSPFAESRRVSV